MQHTPEQEAIFEAVRSGTPVMVRALAGCGKTTTIVDAVKEIPRTRSVGIFAFNKKIEVEVKDRLERQSLLREGMEVRTLNGLGHGALQRALGRRLTLDTKRIYGLCKAEGLKGDDLYDVRALVTKARSSGLVIHPLVKRGLIDNSEEVWSSLAASEDIPVEWVPVAQKVLALAYRQAMSGTIDFDDQIVTSTLIAGSYPKFDVVIIDEAQDLSPINHLQLKKCLHPSTQLIVVGDPNQAIYAWRGADSSSMETIRSLRGEWLDRTLSLTFRCPRSVVQRQQAYVPTFRAHESNPEGSIQFLSEWHPEGGRESAIICRNNAPLIKLAFACLRERIPVTMLGSDIGANLKRLYNKHSLKGSLSMEKTVDNIEKELSTLDPEGDSKGDRLASLLEVLRGSRDIDQALEFLTEAKHNSITLTTGHRSKGLEWKNVYHLEPQLVPSKYAVQGGSEEALTQEYNLRYVIETRTMQNLRMVRNEGLEL